MIYSLKILYRFKQITESQLQTSRRGRIKNKIKPAQLLIKNYGLFWERDQVFWSEKGGKKSHLKGSLIDQAKANPVDFRDQQAVYALYDDGFNLVYIGQSGSKKSRLFDRLKTHNDKGPLVSRWSKFSWFGLRPVVGGKGSKKLRAESSGANPTHENILNHIEAVLIAVSEPRLNLQSGRFGENVEQYGQCPDSDNLYPTLETMVRKIWKSTPSLE